MSADDVSPDTKPEEDQSGTTEDSSVTNVVRLDEEKYPVRFVMTGPGGNAAMIRDRVYHVGDVIEGMQSVSISPTGVTLLP